MNLRTPHDIIKEFNITETKLKLLIENGMPHLKIGKQLRFVREEVERFLFPRHTKQRGLERSFKDEKGRTIRDYVSKISIQSFLGIGESTLYRLCEQGLPYVKIGRKRFFHREDVLDYLRSPIGKRRKKLSYPNQNKTSCDQSTGNVIITADGSHDEKRQVFGTGVVVTKDRCKKTYSYSYPAPDHNKIASEYYAIRDALLIAKEYRGKPITIGTDQTDFIRSMADNTFPQFKWMKTEPYVHLMNQIKQLAASFGDSLHFVYANQPLFKGAYREAHKKSRTYQKKKKKSPSRPLPSHDTRIEIGYAHHSYGSFYYHVKKDGVAHVAKTQCSTILQGALHLAKRYASSIEGKLSVHIDRLPSFEKDVEMLRTGREGGPYEMVLNTLHHLKKTSSFTMDDRFEESATAIGIA
ncbi:helix-turn-helix domain-containing protein (plasmid) [Pontibacillus sp. ALD_SL1]|uniref:helix-turn-helix domain-containing protein n=1 Tax=Pontibacillus sp. ALD_SL1 TaxID=2777185 RepID=UPI001A970B2A|nr:helix-turn-helix domain-containing protein [Pontibacillus sp. ALD_SL1]QST02789.1 helix-turn-helix domain-containing protein [Pontibacillus sp. ALD_SL1]